MQPSNVWQPGVHCAVAISINLDAESVDLHEVAEQDLYGRFSFGRYGMRAGVWRLLDLLRSRGLHASMFIPAQDAERHAEVVERVLADGHELGARGLAYEDHAALGAAERETLERAHALLTRIAGRAPIGWRAPGGTLSPDTLAHLIDLGYLYDSSFQDDDYPYVFAGEGDRCLVEIPQTGALEDAMLYGQRHSHERVLKTWLEDFDAFYDEGSLVHLTLHARGEYGSGRGSRVRVVERFIDQVARRPGVRFVTCGELARWWLENRPEREPLPKQAA